MWHKEFFDLRWRAALILGFLLLSLASTVATRPMVSAMMQAIPPEIQKIEKQLGPVARAFF